MSMLFGWVGASLMDLFVFWQHQADPFFQNGFSCRWIGRRWRHGRETPRIEKILIIPKRIPKNIDGFPSLGISMRMAYESVKQSNKSVKQPQQNIKHINILIFNKISKVW